MSEFNSLQELRDHLHTHGCTKCSLGFQEGLNGCCVARGDPSKQRMIIGEAPGKHEDATSEPFVGPAGQLMDKIFAAVGLDTEDFYVTNIVLCRPIAAKGSEKENYTPRIEQRERCVYYLNTQIEFIKPRLIVTMGRPATEMILGRVDSMGAARGQMKIVSIKGQDGAAIVFPMLHPAAILHAARQPEKERLYKEQTWEDIKTLKKLIEENNL